MTNILIIGGLGFIGSHLVDNLINLEHTVVIYDNCDPQSHPDGFPTFNTKAIIKIGDMRDKKNLLRVIQTHKIKIIYYLAAAVGVAQSMYDQRKFYANNTYSASVLSEILSTEEHNVKQVILTSTMSVYGENYLLCRDCRNIFEPEERKKIHFNCNKCGSENITTLHTDENHAIHCTTHYAISKFQQEEILSLMNKVTGIKLTILRLFCVYGTNQNPNNPYTGIIPIFTSAFLNDEKPIIYEDGNQIRDMVYVEDVCQALILAMKCEYNYRIYNIGSGNKYSILKICNTIRKILNSTSEINITNKLRVGDVRNISADISRAEVELKYHPKYTLLEGIQKTVEWIKKQKLINNNIKAHKELENKNLLKNF